jgi:hypothetical protein
VVAVSADVQLDDGDSLSIPGHELTVRDGGQRVRLEWRPQEGDGRLKARALFRVVTDDNLAVLVSLDCWAVSQRPVAVPDWCDSLHHIPDGLLLVMDGAGYTPAAAVNESPAQERLYSFDNDDESND